MPVRWPGGGLNLFGRWYSGAPMPTGRAQFAAVVLGGWIYCLGGFNGVQYLDTVEAYDPASDTWLPRAPMPTPRAGAVATVLDGKIHVIGGYNGNSGALAVHEVYDPPTDTWDSGPSLPEPLLFAGAVTLRRQVLVVGGYTGSVARALTRLWQPGAPTWVQRAALPVARYRAGVAALSGLLYVVGGRTDTAAATDRLHRYDPVADRWDDEIPMPGARDDVHAVGLHHYLHVLGGAGYDPFHQAFHTVRKRWERRAPLPLGRDEFAAVRLGGDRIAVIGGYRGGVYLNRVDIWWALGGA